MASLNKVMLIGNLTRDPEVRYTPGGRPVCDLRMAVSRRFKRANGEDGEETCFLTVVVWDKTAENCKQYLTKGSPLFVEGRLQMDEWEKDGKKNSILRVLAERIQFLGGSRQRGEPSEAGDPSDRPAPGRPAAGPRPADGPKPLSTPPRESEGGGDGEGPAGDDENLPF